MQFHPKSYDAGILLTDVLPHARPLSTPDIRFKSCVTDAERVRSGDLFVAIETADFDGHFEASEAVHNGAKAVITERMVPVSVPQFLVRDSREALAYIGNALAGYPTRKSQVVTLVDATYSVAPSVLACSVLERAGHETGLVNEAGACDGVRSTSQPHLLHAPLAFSKWLSECEANRTSRIVIGARPVDLVHRALAPVDIETLVLTGLRPGRRGDHPDVVATSRKLLEQVQDDGVLLYHQHDPTCRAVAEYAHVPALSFGLDGGADITGQILESHQGEQTVLIEAFGDYVAVRTRPFGRTYAEFCLAAAAVGIYHGVDLADLAIAIEFAESFPRWLQPVHHGQSFGVYLDQSDDPWTVRRCLETLRSVTAGRLITVAPAIENATHDERALLGRVVEQISDAAILTSSRDCEPFAAMRAVHELLDGWEQPQTPTLSPDRDKAIQAAIDLAEPDDVVVVLGCRSAFNDERSDASVIAEYLERPVCGDSPVTTPSLAIHRDEDAA